MKALYIVLPLLLVILLYAAYWKGRFDESQYTRQRYFASVPT